MRMSLETRGQEVEWKDRQIITFSVLTHQQLLPIRCFLNMDELGGAGCWGF